MRRHSQESVEIDECALSFGGGSSISAQYDERHCAVAQVDKGYGVDGPART